MKTLKDHWDEYRTQVMPPNPIPIQLSECQLAFYAGAVAMQSLLTSAGDLPEPQVDAVLNGIQGELVQFSAEHGARFNVNAAAGERNGKL